MLTGKQIKCIEYMIESSYTQATIAKKINVSQKTICEWKKDPEFVDALKMAERATLRGLGAEAIRTLRALLRARSETVRLAAAKDVLDRVGHKPEEIMKLDIKQREMRELTSMDVQEVLDSLTDEELRTYKAVNDKYLAAVEEKEKRYES